MALYMSISRGAIPRASLSISKNDAKYAIIKRQATHKQVSLKKTPVKTRQLPWLYH